MSPLAGLPPLRRELALPGFSLGHGSDTRGMTGVTVILCPEGATAAAEARGSATGSRQLDSLVSPLHLATRAHALVFAGGSGFGLSAADPVVEWLRARGKGFATGLVPVPLVPTAILFDLGFGDSGACPDRALVEAALAAAGEGEIAVGSVGAGTGATVGKALGLAQAMKGGFGFASSTLDSGLEVAAAVAVNAFGDIVDGDSGERLAGCRTTPEGRELATAERTLAALTGPAHPWEGNTTLVAVLTNATLAKSEAIKVCQMAFGGIYRTHRPALSLYDGDLVVTLASGSVTAPLNQVGWLAERTVAAAIALGIRAADGFGRLPAHRDLVR